LKVKHVSVVDISKAAVAMLAAPSEWTGRTLECASDDVSGNDIAAALTGVSRVECKYKPLPRFVMRWFMKDLNAIVQFFEDQGYVDADIAAFKAVVPDALDCTAWFKKK
jgi:hypothetical protein